MVAESWPRVGAGSRRHTGEVKRRGRLGAARTRSLAGPRPVSPAARDKPVVTHRTGMKTIGTDWRQNLDWPSIATEPRSRAFVRLPNPGERLGPRPSPSEGRGPPAAPGAYRQGEPPMAALRCPLPNRSVAPQSIVQECAGVTGPAWRGHSRDGWASDDRSVTSDLPPDGEPGGAQRRFGRAPRQLEGNHRGVGAVEKWPPKGPRRVGGCRCGPYPAVAARRCGAEPCYPSHRMDHNGLPRITIRARSPPRVCSTTERYR
jgi:hypothetical protein